ncbi:MAG: S-layer homology domain-containing protein [Clostridia bacterium]|nr:S-layer homology domain-containing protein [Clostridia bacterium]
MKRILALLCVCFLCFSVVAPCTLAAEANAETNQTTSDKDYAQAVDFLQALELAEDLDMKNPDSTVSRAEFASVMLSLLDLKSGSQTNSQDGSVGNKFLGYTNDPDFDENGDWIWKTVEPEDVKELENATPFHDVLTTHPLWEDIKLAAQVGLMRGDENRYFRPNDAITVQEAMKVLVDACGAKVLTEDNFPGGYVKIANRLELNQGLCAELDGSDITVRDLAVACYNALHTEIYERVSYGAEDSYIRKTTGKTLLKYIFQISMTDGTVTANSITGLTEYAGSGEGTIKIDELLYTWDGVENILGQKVRAYYKVKGTRREICYLAIADENRELIVEAEDIIGYTYPYLTYWNAEKQKRVSVGTVNLIYNGKALLDYTDADLHPQKGYLRLLDSEGDGSYETVFVEDVQTLFVSGVDFSQKKIYSNLSGIESLDVSEGTLRIYNGSGETAELSNITRNSVISVTQTKPIQGDPYTVLRYSTKTIIGTVEQLYLEEQEIVLEGNTYQSSEQLDITELEAGLYGTFYLDIYDEIVYFSAEGELQYGYLMALQETGVFGAAYQVKLYNVAQNEFEIYELAKKPVFNKESMEAEKVAKSTLIYDSTKKALIPQMIQFALDSDGRIQEILTCDVKKDEFAKMENVSNERKLQYRANKVNAFIDTKDGGPLFYTDADTKFINIPKTDATDEDSYFPIAMEHDEYYYLDEVYKDGADSSIGKIAVRISDASASAAVEWGEPVYIVTEVEQTLIDGEDAYVIYGMSTNGDASVQVKERDLFETAKSLQRGDLYRYELNQKTGDALLLEKLFDHEKMQMVKGFMKGINPFGSAEDSTTKRVGFINELHLIHGKVMRTTDKGTFLTVCPYLYEITDNVVTGIGDLSTVLTDRITYRASVYSVIVYESEKDRVSVGSYYGDILDAESTAEGSEVVVYSNWSNPRCIFVYK